MTLAVLNAEAFLEVIKAGFGNTKLMPGYTAYTKNSSFVSP